MATQDYRNKLGEKVPGNTTIIGSNLGWKTGGLVHWAWDLGMKGQDYRKVRDEAAGIGTLVHSRIEAHIHGRPQPDEVWFWDGIKDDKEAASKAYDAVENTMLAFFEWQDTAKLEITSSEVPLICECHQYGTTIDHPALVKGRRRIIEIKTSNAVYGDMWIQMAAQGHVWNCNHIGTDVGLAVDVEWVTGYDLLHIDKNTGGFNHLYRPSLPDAWEAFLHLRALHGLKKGIK